MPNIFGTATDTDPGVSGDSNTDFAGVRGSNNGSGVGIRGFAKSGAGVRGESESGPGVQGIGNASAPGVSGESGSSFAGVRGSNSANGVGVRGFSGANAGVRGDSDRDTGVLGVCERSDNIDSPIEVLTSVGVRGVGPIGMKGEGNPALLGVAEQRGVALIAIGETCLDLRTTSMGTLIEGRRQRPAEGGVAAVPPRFERVFRVDASGTGFFNGGTRMAGADIAEVIATNDTVGPGDVVEIAAHLRATFTLSKRPNNSSVAGVISTTPGVTLGASNRQTPAVFVPQLAVTGIVPVKVTSEGGPIAPGDLLVSSSSPGHAMRGPSTPPAGTVIGKALDHLSTEMGVVQMLVMLR